MKYHEYVLLSAMESCPRGRRSMIGNHVGGKHCLKGSNPLLSVSYLQTGPLVKRLRHRPFTAVTRVRVPYGSFFFWRITQVRLKGTVLKTVRRVKPCKGSNPLSSFVTHSILNVWILVINLCYRGMEQSGSSSGS